MKVFWAVSLAAGIFNAGNDTMLWWNGEQPTVFTWVYAICFSVWVALMSLERLAGTPAERNVGTRRNGNRAK